MDVSNQAQIAYGYDNADRLTSVTQGTNVVAFAYDDANRRTSLTLPNGIVTEYGYDAASQLTSLTYKLSGTTIGDLTYTYDAAGQRLGVGGSWARTNLPAALASATYDAANQIATFGGVTFTYDANGSLTSDGTNTYTWNARNQLASISGGSSGSFVYDAAGRRRSKTIGGTSTAFLYDGLNPVQEQSSVTANLLTGLGIDEYFVRTTANTNEQFATDALGSTVALTDASGTAQTSYTYEPFGATITSGTPTANAFGFTGRELDAATVEYFRARYYDPALHRFISEDPLRFVSADLNLYSIVRNSPANQTDPLGLCAWCIAAAVTAIESPAVRAAVVAAVAAITAAAEAAANRRLTEARCWRQYEEDVRRCKQCDPEQRRECYKQAMERYAACKAGRPYGPLFPDEPWVKEE